MKKTTVIYFLLSLFVANSMAQHTLIYTHEDVPFNLGKELFNQRKYGASFRNFEEFLKENLGNRTGQVQESEYYIAANAYELNQPNAQALLEDYLLKHPYTPFSDKANLMLGLLRYEKRRYDRALVHFEKVDAAHLNKRERIDFLFCKGYTYLQTKNYKPALEIFNTLVLMDTKYNLAANYYFAYANYTLGNYKVALNEFLKLEDNPEYAAIVPYYIIQIYYAQNELIKLYERATALLKNNPNNQNNAEIYRIMGEISYRKQDYVAAIGYLKNYERLFPKVLRNDMYLLGVSYYQTGDYKNAIEYFSKTTGGNDEMSENSYLHLGNCYVQLGQKANARLSYEASLRTNVNKNVREEALFNYALTSYESTTAFGESIAAFEQLLTEFPNTKFRDKAYDYLTSVYLTTKNYEAAYKSIIKIQQPSSKLLETKQYLLYQIGTEAFSQNNFMKAIEYFSMSLESSSTGKYSAESYYWRSESYFRTDRPDESISDLKAFFANSYAKTSVNYKVANYGMAYAYFSKRDFSQALTWYLKYMEVEKVTTTSIYADALNRTGDCYYYIRDFNKAENFYAKAIAASPNTGDYAMFQSAYMVGLQKNYLNKISKLERLLATYPKSEYIDDALYEIGRSYLMLESNDKAISTYQRLLDTQPNSVLARKAALEIGMIYFNQNEYQLAIAAYKKVIFRYSGSEESYTALESLETVYIEINDIPAYLAYTKTLGRTISTSTANREDSISYIAAEKQYMNAKYAEAISGMRAYLNRFCSGGRYCTTAQYYIADSYYRIGEKDNALNAFKALLKISGNQFAEEATMRCAEITYDNKDFANSLTYFKQLELLAQSNEKRNVARLGVLRCNYFLKNNQSTIEIANEILSDSRSSEDLKMEARFNRAKANIAMGNAPLATQDLKVVSQETRSLTGAESKYLLANNYFQEGNMTDAEAEVLDFSKKNTPHQYWLARSFVLLADVYIKQENDFQAKQYLLSLQKNYTAVDDIQILISERLKAIADRESQKIIE